MSSYRSYVPWSKSSLGSSYSGSGSGYAGIPKSAESTSSKPAASDTKNDSGYSARRYGTTTSTASTGTGSTTGTSTGTSSRYPSSYTPTERTTSTPSKYGTPSSTTTTDRTPTTSKYGTPSSTTSTDRTSTPSKYGSSSSSSSSYLGSKDKDKYSSTTSSTPTPTKDTKENDRPSIREKYNMGPALPSSPPKSVKEASDKPAVSHRQSLIDKYSTSRSTDTPRSYSSGTADKKDETPSTAYSRSLSRTPARPEPEPDKTSSYGSTLSPYRLYGRTSSPYARSTSRDESAVSSTASSPAVTPTTNPTSLRYGRYSVATTASPRSPVNDRPSVTSPTPDKSRSGRTSRQEDEESKTKDTAEGETEVKVETRSVAVVTRGTSPTAPSTSSFLRTRRADLARVIEKTVERPVARPEMVDKEVQSDRGDDTARLSRFGSTSRSAASPWASYLDRYPSASVGYSPTVAKYSTKNYSTSGYGTTPRGDREATVTTSSPMPSATPTPTPTPTPTVTDTLKPAPSTVKAGKDDAKEAVRPADSVATKAKSDKQDESKKEDDLGLSKVKTKTEVPGLKRTPSFTKPESPGLKRAPSFTKVADVVLKRVSSSPTKADDKKAEVTSKADGDKKPPTAKKTEETSKTETELKAEVEKKPVPKKVEGTEKTPVEVKLSGEKVKAANKVDAGDKLATKVEPKVEPEKMPVVKLVNKADGSDKPASKAEPEKMLVAAKKVETKTEEKTYSVAAKTGEKGADKAEAAKPVEEKKVSPKKVEESVGPKPKPLTKSPSAAKVDAAKVDGDKVDVAKVARPEDGKKPSQTVEKPKDSAQTVPEETKKPSEPSAGTKPTSTDSQRPGEETKVEDIDVLKGALAGLIRASSDKPPIKKTLTKADSLSESESEGVKSKSSSSPSTSASEKKKSLKKLITKTDSLSESESENLKVKSSSPSQSESDKLKTPPLSPPPTIAASLAKLGSPSTNRKFLPPPVPRTDGKTSPHSLNKDFRKSALNTDVSAAEAEELKKLRLASNAVKKTKRSASASSDDASESSEAARGASNPPSTPEAHPPLATSKSLSSPKLAASSSSTKLGPKLAEPKRNSRSPSIHKSASSSEESDSSEETTSSSSSSDDEAEETPSRSSASNMPQSSKSPSTFDKNKSLLSTSSSKCLNLASSADESSLADKPPRPPSSPKPPQKEEAKSFLMRALAPVTNLFKSRTQESGVDSSNENLSENLPRSESTQSLSKSVGSDKDESKKSESVPKKPHKIRHIESGERAWWLDSSENIPDGVQRIKSSKSISKMSSDSEPDAKKKEKGMRKHKIRHIESGERAWWLDSAESIPEDSESVSLPKKSSGSETDSKTKKERTGRRNKIRHIESGERAWWMDNNDSIPEDSESISVPKLALNSEKVNDPDDLIAGRKLRKQESGERAWWLDSNPNIPEGIERIKSSTSVNKLSSESDQDALQQANAAKLKINRIRKQESGERAWWLDSCSNVPEGIQRIASSSSVAKSKESNSEAETNAKKFAIRHQESGEKAWWMNSSNSDIAGGIKKAKSKVHLQSNDKDGGAGAKKSESSDESEESDSSESDEAKNKGALPKFPLEVPRLVEVPSGPESTGAAPTGRSSPYDNVLDKAPVRTHKKRPKNRPLFISNHTNIDDILGTAASLVEPITGGSRNHRPKEEESSDDDDDDDNCEEVEAAQVRIHDSTAKQPTIRRIREDSETSKKRQSEDKLDDTALQLYKDGDYGSYLDLEASISEQQEEFEGFQANRKNSIVVRTQLSVRVHTIIEKLLNSEGRELRRALFSLKQIFQEDKDLVHEFVQNDGLACLIKVGSEADQNYQNYILRALGQVMLYVDGMNGVMEHNRTVQWLYTLIASKFRLVVKTALKLLLVFVEYVDTNCMLLIKAVNAVDSSQGLPSWSNVMRLVKDYDSADTELLTYATTLLNKTLNGVPDQDTYYDQVDALEEQGVEGAIQRYMSKQGTDLDLLRQFQIYEAVLHHEDGEEKGTPLRQLDEAIRKTLRNRQSPAASLTLERRKSRRHSTGASPIASRLRTTANNNNNNNYNNNNNLIVSNNIKNNKHGDDDGDETGSSSSRSSPGPGEVPHLNGSYKDKQTDDAGVTPALRRRRERAERQRSFIREQQETSATLRATRGIVTDDVDDENELSQRMNGSLDASNKLNRVSSRNDLTPLMNAVNKLDSADTDADATTKTQPWSRYSKNGEEVIDGEDINAEEDPTSGRKLLLNLKRESTVKDLTQKLASQNILNSPTEEKVINRIGDMSGLISKAKEGLAKSKSKVELLKSASGDVLKMVEAKKSETELHWEELVSGMSRPLELCDLDFTDLRSDDEQDVLSPTHAFNGIPPPPPPAPMAPMSGKGGPPPPPPNRLGSFVPPPCPTTPTSFGVNLRHQRSSTATSPEKSAPQTPQTPSSKTKKTVKLFWKEVRDDPLVQRLQKTGMIWDELSYVAIDTQKLEHLFESRAKDLITKKQQEMNKTKEIIVLDHKRSNAINIGMTKLPPPRSIKTAILKMDATIMTREGIEKLLTMLPTEDEQSKIQEAQLASPDMPLGSAEQFLLTLASISELSARLKLWAFKLDYENSEKEVAEPLMDLKQGVETLRSNKTFRGILGTLLSIGIFLNGNEVKGFQIEYLAKVPEVKDTVHKHSLLHHLCHMVMEKFPEATDLYSEIGAVTRASKVDFDELAANIHKMETECKASWDHLKDIAKHDGSTIMKVKMTDFLADCAERIIVLGIVHRRVMNRYHKFLLWLGIPLFRVADMKPSEFCRIVSEFALEYRTTRERVLLQLEKKANHRERNKTRGKMITEVGKFRTKEDRADAELRQLLGTHGTSDLSDAETTIHGTLPWRRQRKDGGRTVLGPLLRDETANGNVTDGDDEILESLVKTATKAPGTRTMPRERKRTRHADRKSLRRTLKNGLSEEDKKHLAAYIKGY